MTKYQPAGPGYRQTSAVTVYVVPSVAGSIRAGNATRRKRRGVGRARVDPAGKPGGSGDGGGLDGDEATQRAPGEVHRAHVRRLQGVFGVIAVEADHEILPQGAARPCGR